MIFPKDSEKRQKWWSVIPLKGKFYESAKICSLHFKPENYDPLRPKRLLNSAVPVDSVQLCSCGNNVMASTTPFKCSASSNETIPTHNTHSENIVVDENEPPAKRRRLKDFNVQCKIKSLGKSVWKKRKKITTKSCAK
ncbi:hypothetical protein HW555_013040 [Spodoptera exigua]|uniref:THAP-type domain-containing protein n=2 Tax=Spodoptera exigua TaxID=7107 RepID=A0A835G3R1_SPOEX|nr:hypothetical protein HW555_013040 [Spodoptera exigua]